MKGGMCVMCECTSERLAVERGVVSCQPGSPHPWSLQHPSLLPCPVHASGPSARSLPEVKEGIVDNIIQADIAIH